MTKNNVVPPGRGFFRALAIAYAIGFLLHVADLAGWRLNWSRLPAIERAWIGCLLVGDLVAAIGLWRGRGWGTAAFVVIALVQIAAYTALADPFGREPFLVGFHLATLGVYAGIQIVRRSA